jgi:hypothetical protein
MCLFEKLGNGSCLFAEIGKFGVGVFSIVCVSFVFGVIELLNDGCFVTVIGDYLFNSLILDAFIMVIQSVGVHSIDHVSNGCVFLFRGMARVLRNDDVGCCGLAVDIEG